MCIQSVKENNLHFNKFLFTGFADTVYNYTFDDLLPYVESYLEEKFRVLGKDPADISEKDVKTFHWCLKMSWIVCFITNCICTQDDILYEA